MSAPFLRLAAPLLAAATLQACAQIPPDYSADYVQVPVASRNHPDRFSHYELVPRACLVPDPTAAGLAGSRLPPGCANNANLLAMVERKKDVVKGRKLGAAPASPSARAAQKYIYGSPANLGSGTPPSSGVGISPSAPPAAPAGTSGEVAAAPAK